MTVGWALENAVLVNAPAWRVWQSLCDVLHWPELTSTGLYGRPLGLRENFTFTISPLGLPVKVKALVSVFRPLQVLGWQGKFWGIHSQVRVRLIMENEHQTRLLFQENLSGWGLLLFSALFSMKRLVAINQAWLEALARQCENSQSG